MQTKDIFAADAVDLTGVPDDKTVTSIAEAAQALVAANQAVADLELQLETAKGHQKELAHKVLPRLFEDAGTDRLGVPGADVDVVIRDYFHANVSPEVMDEEKFEAALDHLEEVGAADLIKTRVVFTFGRGELATANQFLLRANIFLKTLLPDAPPGTLSRSIPWATLTAFVKEWYQNRDAELENDVPQRNTPTLNLSLLNATIGKVAKIEVRKAARLKRTLKAKGH